MLYEYTFQAVSECCQLAVLRLRFLTHEILHVFSSGSFEAARDSLPHKRTSVHRHPTASVANRGRSPFLRRPVIARSPFLCHRVGGYPAAPASRSDRPLGVRPKTFVLVTPRRRVFSTRENGDCLERTSEIRLRIARGAVSGPRHLDAIEPASFGRLRPVGPYRVKSARRYALAWFSFASSPRPAARRGPRTPDRLKGLSPSFASIGVRRATVHQDGVRARKSPLGSRTPRRRRH